MGIVRQSIKVIDFAGAGFVLNDSDIMVGVTTHVLDEKAGVRGIVGTTDFHLTVGEAEKLVAELSSVLKERGEK